MAKGEGASLTARLELPQRLEAPVTQGSPVGELAVYSGETCLGRWPVRAADTVERLDLRRGLARLVRALTAM